MSSLFERVKKSAENSSVRIGTLERECGFSNGSIRKWTSQSPTIEKIMAVAERLGVSVEYLATGNEIISAKSDITTGDKEVLESISSLSEIEKVKLAGAIPLIVAFQRNPTSPAQQQPLIFPTSSEFGVPIYDVPSSAGTGLYLDSEDYTVMTFPADEVPQETSFGVRLRGDSMTPDFEDGDIVFLKRLPELQPNEIGIFVLDGNAYCKKFIRNEHGAVLLKSLNPQYDPIPINECSDLRVLGKVIGKIHGHF